VLHTRLAWCNAEDATHRPQDSTCIEQSQGFQIQGSISLKTPANHTAQDNTQYNYTNPIYCFHNSP